MKLPVSVVVITKNAEAHIERCLASVPWASEYLVIDSGSEDATQTRAREAGARVLVEAWQGFGPQKAMAAKNAKFDWILALDADESLSPELSAEIVQQFSNLDPNTAYEMPRQSFHMGRWIKHGGWFPDPQVRLFHRGHSMWDSAQIHEQVVAEKKARFENVLRHYVFEDLFDQIETNNRYSSLQAEELYKKNRAFSLFKLITKPWTKFIECYFLKLGFLDGLPGFVIAVGAGYSVFLRWAKLWEKQRCQKSS